jgi:hypothetical protein
MVLVGGASLQPAPGHPPPAYTAGLTSPPATGVPQPVTRDYLNRGDKWVHGGLLGSPLSA